MTLGRAPEQADLWRSSVKYCEGKLSPTSVYGLLHRECHRLFPDAAFADLFQDIGRRSVPPRIVAVVMVLQRLEGLSDREAVDRFTFDVRWKYAAGGLDLEHPSFVHTVLVDMRARLRASASPDRVFNAVLDVAKQAGVVGRRRVLDSTPLYDAVATQDTVTMIRSAIRGLLRVVAEPLATELRGVLKRDDDYLAAGKPACDWDDKVAREALIDALACDAYAVLAHIDGKLLAGDVQEAASLLATVVGQDLERTEDGLFRIARRVAPDRVISTVDPEARHGHKTSARGFDGYKGHVAIDPDTEIITSAAVTAANVGDGSVAEELLADVLPTPPPADQEAAPADAPGIGADSAPTASTLDTAPTAATVDTAPTAATIDTAPAAATVDTAPTAATVDTAPTAATVDSAPTAATVDTAPTAATIGTAPTATTVDTAPTATTVDTAPAAATVDLAPTASAESEKVEVYGDASYGTAAVLECLDSAGAVANVKVQPPSPPREGLFSKDAFEIDTKTGTVRCPQGVIVTLRLRKDGWRHADFAPHCESCPLRSKCTTSKTGRGVEVHPQHDRLQRHRLRQRNAAWKRDYRATRPKVERKLAHLMRRKHGGRRARMRGSDRVGQDFILLCAATNLHRLAQLGLHCIQGGAAAANA